MKKWMVVVASLCLFAMAVQAQKYVPTPENLESRKNFAESRFGVFLHWGLYSMFAQGEWYMNNDSVDAREYAKAMNAFYPHRFDAQAWVSAIKAAGPGTSVSRPAITRVSRCGIRNTPTTTL